MNSKLFYINSAKRFSGTNENFMYKMDFQANEFTHFVVLALNIPLSYYLIQNGFNTFILVEKGIETIVTVPEGNYNAGNFSKIIEQLLNAASPNKWIYKINLNNISGKYTFTVVNNDSQPSFKFFDHINEQFGFNSKELVTFNDNALESSNVVKFINHDTLYLRSNLYQGDGNIICEIYHNNTSQYSNITYTCQAPEYYSKQIAKLQDATEFRFWLTDDNAEHIINLNGLPIFITLLVYKKDDVNGIIKDYINYKINK